MNEPSILVVEDEAIIAADLELKLRRLGYRVSGTTNTGEQAVTLVRQQPPDLVLMDIRLAGAMDGIEAAREIRSQNDVPLVFLTAHSDEATLERAGQTEPFGFITKPFHERDLHIHIKTALYKHAAERQLLKSKEHLSQLNATLEERVAKRTQELEQTHRALLLSEQRYRSLAEALPDFVAIVNRSGTYEYANAVAKQWIGPPREDLVGQSIAKTSPIASGAMLKEEIDQVLRRGQPVTFQRPSTIHAGHWLDFRVVPLQQTSQSHDSVLIIGRDITERKRLEAEVLRISEDERKRIGDDLHDDLGQQLTGIRLFSTTLANQLRARSAPEADRAATITDSLDKALNLTRSLARGLHPVAASPEGLMIALDDLTSRTSGLFGLPCSFVCRNPVHIHQPAVATHLFRIAQEAVTNAVKHAHASQIEIKLSSNNRSTELSIRDDGTGIPIFDPVVESTGMGMRIMNYRADMIGGTLQIQRNASGAGTTVTCTILAAAAQL